MRTRFHHTYDALFIRPIHLPISDRKLTSPFSPRRAQSHRPPYTTGDTRTANRRRKVNGAYIRYVYYRSRVLKAPPLYTLPVLVRARTGGARNFCSSPPLFIPFSRLRSMGRNSSGDACIELRGRGSLVPCIPAGPLLCMRMCYILSAASSENVVVNPLLAERAAWKVQCNVCGSERSDIVACLISNCHKTMDTGRVEFEEYEIIVTSYNV